MDIIGQYQTNFESTIQHFREELQGIRTGRATPALVENIPVMAYNTLSKLKALASISVLDSRTLKVEPWDKTIVKDIEKAIVESPGGLNPQNEGGFLRIPLSALTEENRREFIKVLSQKSEASRIALRQIRDEIREKIVGSERDGEITEDDKYLYFKKLDETVNEYNQKIKEFAQEKEKDIMTI